MASNPSSSRSTQYVIWGSALVVLILAVYSIRSLTRERVSIHIADVTYQDVSNPKTTNGKVQPISDYQVKAPAAGQIEEIYVKPLEQIKAGQLLLKMDDRAALAGLAHANSTLQAAELAASNVQHGGTQDERNTSAADLSRARVQLQQDQSILAERQKLGQSGADSTAEVSEAQRRVDLDQTNLRILEEHSTQRYGKADQANAQADLTYAHAAVAAAQSGYNNADFRSPISGTVYYLPVARHDYVNAGDDLVFVADLTRLRITAYFDEPDIGSLAVGQAVKITWEAHPEKTWHGHVSLAPTTIISYGNTRNVGECFITVDDADGVLQPNATVNVTVTTAQDAHVLTAPREALHFDGQQAYVFRVVHDKLVRTPIKLGRIVNNEQVEVASGLASSDVVALNATTPRDLSNGLEVIPVQ